MNLNFKKTFLAILIIFLSVSIGFAGPRNKLGTNAAPELLIPVGSIGTSLAGSNLAYTSGLDAMFWNPAGLAQLNSTNAEVLFSHMNYFADMKMEYFCAAAKIGNIGVIGGGIKSLNIGEIYQTTELQPEGTGTVFKPTYITANLSFARQMTDRIKFGTNVKIINENVAEVSATGFAFDFGIQYVGGESGFTFGIAIKNLGPSMRFNGPGLDREVQLQNGQKTTQRVILQDFDLPTNLELGFSYSFARYMKDMNVVLSAAFQNSSFSSDEYRFGLEYSYKNILYVRGAFNLLPQKETDERLFGPTFGVGLRYPVGGVMIGLDYAYRVMNEKGFDNTNQFFTINLGF
ncbi:MAG: PorV/PorQ family protein [Ignavibacteria bacterium]|nr:PorV/PorQ family protein [Ignavibacteria bacterium]